MKSPVGTTFVVAASLLGVAAVAQLVAVLVYFGPHFTGEKVVASASAVPAAATPAPEPVEVLPAATPGPEHGPEVSAEETAKTERLAELMKEVEKLEDGSSPGDALVPLEEARSLDPRNPEILSRLAGLNERMGHNEMAEDIWKNLLDLGPDAGRYLDVAEIRLRLLRQQGATAVGTGYELRDQVGLQPGSTLGVVDAQLTDGNEGDHAVKNLRLAVKARPGEEIDGQDLRINVTFYEKLNGEVVLTTSRAQSMWFTPPVDWKDEGIEILEVKYEVPRITPDGDLPPPFYGYMVNIYYGGQLQETRADPVDLQELFPPPLNEAPEEGFVP